MRWLPSFLLLLVACEKTTIVVDKEDTAVGFDDTGSAVSGSIAVAPTSLDFGVLFVGQQVTDSFTVTNVGEGDVSVTVQIVGGWATAYTLDSYTSAPAPGETATHTVSLLPTNWGVHDVSLLVDDAESGGHVELPVHAEVQEDADGDGVGSAATGGEDCDDTDAAVHPGAEDTWYDGVDADCGGNDDYDQDADGHAAAEYGGDDCTDTDAAVHPGAEDLWYDGLDSDCAGNDDYDQDGDGHVPPAYGGDDCDDTDASIHPGAADTWYDGVDSDCAGNDDYDQDGDGHTSADYGGDDCNDTDATIYAGAPETWYDGIDSDCAGDNDYDQDGDGVEWPTDCVDTDPTITGPTDETLNGNDDDCDGLVDNLAIADAASGYLLGTVASQHLGDHGLLSMGPDVTGDGLADLILGAPVTSTGYAWIVDGLTATTAAGVVSDYDTMALTGESVGGGYYYQVGWLNGPMDDVDGDGTADLAIGGSYSYSYSYSYARSYLFYGGSALSGSMGASSYDVRVSGDGSYSTDSPRMSALGDVDGDGQADLIVGAYYDSSSDEDNCGSVSFFSGAGLSGSSLDLDDADDRIYGKRERDYLGYSLVSADLDGDGYADAISGAPYYDGGSSNGGGVFVFAGNSSMAWDHDADDAASVEIRGDTSYLYLGDDTLAHPGDVDGDGDLDLGLTSESAGDVWLFLGGSTLSGTYDHTDADHNISGTAGDLGSMLILDSDLDGDGADEIVVGADGDDTAASNAGVVWVFSWSSSWGASLTSADARATLYGSQADGYFGSGVAGGADLDGDGLEDVALGEFTNDDSASDAGAVWIVRGW
jgi:hypothetical protein